MKKIITKNKTLILVDNEDFEWLSAYKWQTNKNGQIFRWLRKDGRYYNVAIGREIMEHRGITIGKLFVDHINGKKYDNRKQNLRLATNQQNLFNQKINKNNKSGYKGVVWNKTAKKWEAGIKVNRKRVYLGVFEQPELAYRAYVSAAKDYFGEFARL